MKLKKLLSLSLATVMAASLAVPAFADDPVPGVMDTSKAAKEAAQADKSVTMDGAFYTPVIRLTVTDPGKVYVNPQKGTISGKVSKIVNGVSDLEYSFKGEGIVSAPIVIRNDTVGSAVGVYVTEAFAYGTGEGSAVKFTDSNPESGEKEVALEITGNGTTSVDVTSGKIDKTVLSATGGGLTAGEDGTYASLEDAFLAAACAPATNGDKTEKDDGADTTKLNPTYGIVAIKGELAEDVKWTESDTVGVYMVMSFVVADAVTDFTA